MPSAIILWKIRCTMPNSNVKKCEHLLIDIRFWETAYLPLP